MLLSIFLFTSKISAQIVNLVWNSIKMTGWLSRVLGASLKYNWFTSEEKAPLSAQPNASWSTVSFYQRRRRVWSVLVGITAPVGSQGHPYLGYLHMRLVQFGAQISLSLSIWLGFQVRMFGCGGWKDEGDSRSSSCDFSKLCIYSTITSAM